jgi:2-dehydro-3-deoxy-D-gluconate 5-dehydrogenase
MRLKGRTALVTGGSRGIGRAIALALGEEGADVAVNYVSSEGPARDVVENIKKMGRRAMLAQADVGDYPDTFRMAQEVLREFGHLDILVNNAGINDRRRPELFEPEAWQAVLDVNLSGAFFAAQAAYPEMKRAGGGKIVNIGSMMSIFGASFAAPYAASKGGIVQLTKALATAWAADGIQVNAVLPGWIDTELTQTARRQVEGLHERVLARTPAARWGTPADLAGIAVFLASPASDFVTGAAIPVDGGYSSQG